LIIDNDYKIWLADIKSRLRNVQIKAALKVNAVLLNFYWELGADIVAKQEKTTWGDGLLPQLSKDLMAEFPEIKGFSRTNLLYMRKWHLFYRDISGNVPQVVGQMQRANFKEIFQIPWGHNREIISKCRTREEAIFYVQNTRHGTANGGRSLILAFFKSMIVVIRSILTSHSKAQGLQFSSFL